MPHWVEDLRYSVEVFSEAGSLEQVLARLHDLEAARAAYAIALPKHPGKVVMLCWKAQILRRSHSR